MDLRMLATELRDAHLEFPTGSGDDSAAGKADSFVEREITDVVHDSRAVRPGALFCCVRGERTDGHDHAADAVAAGAVGLLVDHRLDLDCPQIVVPETRAAMAVASSRCFGDPSRSMTVVGVTGTNGKTTTSLLLGAVLEHAGRRSRVLGTLSGHRTTPEAPDLQRRLRSWLDEGVECVVMEVSSHALSLHRVDATRFGLAVFTNLSRDHLDFHGTMEEYFAAKARLFTPEFADRAVVNLDSPYGRLLDDASTIPTVGYRLEDAKDLTLTPTGSEFIWRGHRVSLPLVGTFNVANALAAATAASSLGVDESAIAEGLSLPLSVPGRFERVEMGQPFLVAVDFAHTPDGLATVLAAARDLVARDRIDGAVWDGTPEGDGRVIVVFGCGGDRDATKRPAMGEAAVQDADVVIVTADNSRSESTAAIIEQIMVGIERARDRRAVEVVVEPDRRAAIAIALGRARPGDAVILAGKGHETTLEADGRVIEFDDRVVAAEEWDRLGGPR